MYFFELIFNKQETAGAEVELESSNFEA